MRITVKNGIIQVAFIMELKTQVGVWCGLVLLPCFIIIYTLIFEEIVKTAENCLETTDFVTVCDVQNRNIYNLYYNGVDGIRTLFCVTFVFMFIAAVACRDPFEFFGREGFFNFIILTAYTLFVLFLGRAITLLTPEDCDTACQPEKRAEDTVQILSLFCLLAVFYFFYSHITQNKRELNPINHANFHASNVNNDEADGEVSLVFENNFNPSQYVLNAYKKNSIQSNPTTVL